MADQRPNPTFPCSNAAAMVQPLLYLMGMCWLLEVSLGSLFACPRVNLSSHYGSTQTYARSLPGASPSCSMRVDQAWKGGSGFHVCHWTYPLIHPPLCPSHDSISSCDITFDAHFAHLSQLCSGNIPYRSPSLQCIEYVEEDASSWWKKTAGGTVQIWS